MHEYAKTETGFAQQLPKNLIANILYFLINVAIGLYLVPYFISTLGVAAYGLIPLATSFTGYVGILVQSINTAVTRLPHNRSPARGLSCCKQDLQYSIFWPGQCHRAHDSDSNNSFLFHSRDFQCSGRAGNWCDNPLYLCINSLFHSFIERDLHCSTLCL